MKIAVLADIHSNYIALEHCMGYALKRGITNFLFLGDYIGEMAYPERTMNLIYQYQKEYNCHFISGNKEKYWLNYRDNRKQGWSKYNSTTGALFYAYQHLSQRDLDFFESLPISKDITFEGFPTLTICHGSPRNVHEPMISNNILCEEIIKTSATNYILCGHTHIQGKYLYYIPSTNNAYITTGPSSKTILNPGSVGLPLKSDSSSQFMILHGEKEKWNEEFINISYNEREVIDQLKESGLREYAPYWCQITEAILLSHGNCPYGHAEVLERTMELCRQDTGICHWPNIPEKYWKTAMEELFP